jgi:hypothetical protein
MITAFTTVRTSSFSCTVVYRHLPVDALHGIGCYIRKVKAWLDSELRARGIRLQTIVRPGWYF